MVAVPPPVALARAVALRALVVLVLLRVEWLLRRSPITAVCTRLDVTLGAPVTEDGTAAAPGLPSDRGWTILHRLRVVDAVAPWWPFGDTCLRRCLVLAVLLRRDHPVLRLGVKRKTDGSITAHSWLEIEGLSLDPTSESYLRLAG